jgi:hypothetical protein
MTSLPEESARAMEPIIVYLEDRRLKLLTRTEAVQQGAAAIVLIAAGYERFSAPDQQRQMFALGLLAAGALLFLAAMRELRGRRTQHPGLLNLAAGIALLTEWGVAFAENGRIVRPSLLMGAISLGLWMFHRPLERGRRSRRTLRMDADGVSFRLNPFRRFHVRWTELASISIESTEIRFSRAAGQQHRIPLGRLENAGEVSAAVMSACRAAGVECRIVGAAHG